MARLVGSTKLLTSALSALLLSLVVLTSAPALAHADQSLIASDPQPQAELDRAPGWVNLAFDSPVDAGIAKVLVLNADGKNVTTGDLIVEFNTITTQLSDGLPEGTYTVQYRADETGEPLGGSFQFSYGSGSFSPDAETTWEGVDDEPAVIKNPDPNATSTPPPPSTAPGEPSPVEPTEGNSTEPVPGAAPSEGADPDSSASTEGEPGESAGDGDTPLLAWVIGGGVLLLVLAGALVWYLRTRNTPRP